jgi:hypothetical protein
MALQKTMIKRRAFYCADSDSPSEKDFFVRCLYKPYRKPPTYRIPPCIIEMRESSYGERIFTIQRFNFKVRGAKCIELELIPVPHLGH